MIPVLRWLVYGFLVCTLAGLGLSAPAPSDTPPATIAGKWVGTLDIVHADGSVEPGQAYFSLTQNAQELTGSAGNSPTHRSPITSGKLAGNTVSLTVAVSPLVSAVFDLRLEGGHLKGTATGIPAEAGSRIVIDAIRADGSWQSSAPIAHVPDRLFDTLAALDRKLFDAYNTCDLGTISSLVTDDLEFYHDKTGLAVGKVVFLDAIKNNICGKVQRTLVPGTLEVHRLAGYGAVEIGRHRFHHPGHEQDGVGEAKFVTIWHLKDGNWQITRAISYDHEPAKN